MQDHCDFSSLYKVLFTARREELIGQTTHIYESYRARKLSFLAAIDEVKNVFQMMLFNYFFPPF